MLRGLESSPVARGTTLRGEALSAMGYILSDTDKWMYMTAKAQGEKEKGRSVGSVTDTEVS